MEEEKEEEPAPEPETKPAPEAGEPPAGEPAESSPTYGWALGLLGILLLVVWFRRRKKTPVQENEE